jgi:hypothetical protein
MDVYLASLDRRESKEILMAILRWTVIRRTLEWFQRQSISVDLLSLQVKTFASCKIIVLYEGRFL